MSQSVKNLLNLLKNAFSPLAIDFIVREKQKILELSGKTIRGNPVNISSLYIGGKLEAERKGRLNLPKSKIAYQGLIISFIHSLV